jgi:4-amino-4-deoxy-L-arabinose transferase-like glycosyltransferase
MVAGLWLLQSLVDRLWFAMDRTMPAWDEADYLMGSLAYWHALQTPQWLSGEWWTNLWMLSTKIPPLVYLTTAALLNLLGPGPDQSTWVLVLFGAILLASVYGLGVYLFNVSVGVWAASFCVLMPSFYVLRLEYLLDYPVAAMVALCFLCLTIWRSHLWATPLSPVVDRTHHKQDPIPSNQPIGMTAVVEHGRGWAIALVWPLLAGLSLGLALMTKQTAAQFLLVPFAWVLGEIVLRQPWWQWIWQWIGQRIGQRAGWRSKVEHPAELAETVIAPPFGNDWVPLGHDWAHIGARFARQLTQFAVAMAAALLVFYPWYRTNWLLILTSSKRATIDSAIAEGNPALASLQSLFYYLLALPSMVSWLLLVPAGLGLVFFWRRSRASSLEFNGGRWGPWPLPSHLEMVDFGPKSQWYRQQCHARSRQSLGWLLVFLLGAYVLVTLNPNKDNRYIAPYLPGLAVVLAYGWVLLPRKWRLWRWGAISAATLLMVSSQFPILAPNVVARTLAPNIRFPRQDTAYPQAEVAQEVVQVAPFLQSTIGVLPSTPRINQHNVNYYGALNNFQVYGRQVGTRLSLVQQDRRSLPFFLTKTGDQGSIRKPEPQRQLTQSIEQGQDFILQKDWALPDGDRLNLYRRRVPNLEVKAGTPQNVAPSEAPVQLIRMKLPAQAQPGKPVPVTYEWAGSWQALQQGFVILTWQIQGEAMPQTSWFHDHAIALGELYPAVPSAGQPSDRFTVTERLAMLPPAAATPGTYRLKGVYLNRQTNQATVLPDLPIRLQLSPTAPVIAAPELDWVTQHRELAKTLPQGVKALDRLSDKIAQLNQYDPVQDYVKQSRQAAEYRLQQEPTNLELAYTVALADVLERRVDPAIAALQRVTQLDAKNPYAHAYLAFVNLYDFRPRAAQAALADARQLAPNLPELHALTGIAALMQGHIGQAWHELKMFQQTQQSSAKS